MPSNDELYDALQDARETMQKQDEILRVVTAEPFQVGTVIQILEKKRLLVSIGNELMVVRGDLVPKAKPGNFLYISSKTQAALEIANLPMFGLTGEVKVVNPTSVEVDVNGRMKIIQTMFKHEIGDKVTVDLTETVVTNAIPQERNPQSLNSSTDVDWDDIGGLEDAKAQLREMIEFSSTHTEIFKFFGRPSPKGALLFGPPGCGKTLLAKAAATAQKRVAKTPVAGFFYVKGPELLDKYVGTTEQRIRNLFKAARDFGKTYKSRAIIFIDEIDAIARKRGTGKSSDIENTIVPSLLAEMDGIDNVEYAPIVLFATNLQDMLDPAIVRDGRIDRKIYVGAPDTTAAKNIFSIYLKKVPLKHDLTETLGHVVNKTFQDRPMYRIHMHDSEPAIFHFRDMLSGAMISGIVNRAVGHGIRKAVGTKKLVGLTLEDFEWAIETSVTEHREMDNSELLRAFCGPRKALGVEKL